MNQAASLDPRARELIEEARDVMRQRFRRGHHHVGAALRTRSGAIFRGIHLEATVGRIAVCAEAIALGVAAMSGDTDVEQIVAVDREGRILSPCGMCRELISDFSPTATVIVPGRDGPSVVSLAELLPHKYEGRKKRR